MALGTAAFPTPFTPVPPLGDLIYTGSDSHVLVTPTDVDSLTLALNAGESLSLVGTPSTSTQQLAITVLDPSSKVDRHGHGRGAGADDRARERGDCHDRHLHDPDQGCRRQPSAFTRIQAYLNSFVKQGTSNLSIPTAADLSGSSYLLGPGNADRLAVVGSLSAGDLQPGDVFVASQGVNGGQSIDRGD